MEENEKKLSDYVIDVLATVISWFVSAGLILWGWNTIAPHLNAPTFGYWEIFAMRMALGSIASLFRKRG